MIFARQAGAALGLIAISLWLQTGGLAVIICWARTALNRDIHKLGRLRSMVLMVRLTAAMIGLHLLQILLWAGFYRWFCLPSWESAIYFSTASYSTVGSNDVVLPQFWRTMGPVESVVGVLMSGLSAACLFAAVLRLIAPQDGGRGTA